MISKRKKNKQTNKQVRTCNIHKEKKKKNEMQNEHNSLPLTSNCVQQIPRGET